MADPIIVAAVGTFTSHGALGQGGLADALQAAEVAAVREALAEGISIEDGETIRARKAAARQRVLEAQDAASHD